jgi:VIT1/CCC1 family predicted Fe2+/Mn2+ transporter/rubrerythrin
MELKQLEKQLQVETDTAFLYESIAAIQKDENLKKVLLALAEIEKQHAIRILALLQKEDSSYNAVLPSSRAKWQLRMGKIFGYDSIISGLMGIEKQVAKSSIQQKIQKGEPISGSEHNHLRILESVTNNKNMQISSGLLSKFEGRHKSVGGNALRAAVLGANDGLVSNMSLVMGIAGAAASNETILLTGIAGLMAGSISMALGEWLSVQSSRELYLQQIALETQELEASPEDEKKELILLYQAKGMDAENAEKLAEKAFSDHDTALNALVVEELGINREELGGSAWEAAIASFLLFAAGAVIPVFPYFFMSGFPAMYASLSGSVLGLFAIGSVITLFTGKSIWYSGFRQVLFGLAAAAITYGIGALIGVQMAG